MLVKNKETIKKGKNSVNYKYQILNKKIIKQDQHGKSVKKKEQRWTKENNNLKKSNIQSHKYRKHTIRKQNDET